MSISSRVLKPALLFAIVLTAFGTAHAARAATLTWDGGGADNNWSTCANWSSDTCPTSADTATFNTASTKDASIDASFGGTVSGLVIAAGYTGTVSLARDLSVGGSTGVSQAAGTLDISGHTLSFTASGGMSVTGGTFIATNATTSFIGTSSSWTEHLACTGTYPGIVDPGTGAAAFQLNSGCSATLAKTVAKAGPIILAGDATVPSGATMTFTDNNSDLTVTGSLAGLSGLATTTFAGTNSFYTQNLACSGVFPGVVDPGTGGAAFQLNSGCSATLAKTISKTGSIVLAGDATVPSGATMSFTDNNSDLTVTGSLAGLANLATTTFTGTNSFYTQDLTCTGAFPGVVDPGPGASSFRLNAGCSATIPSAVSKAGSITFAGDVTAPSGSTITLSANNAILTVTGSLAGVATTTFTGTSGFFTQHLACTSAYPGVVDPGTSFSTFKLDAGCSATLAKTISKTGSITLDGDATALPGSTITLTSSSGNANLTVTGSLAGLADLATTTFAGNSGSWSQHLACTGAFPGVVDPGAGASLFQLDSGCSITLPQTVSKAGKITLAGDATAPSGSTITLSSSSGSADLTVTGSLAGVATTTFASNSSSWPQHLSCTGAYPGIVDPGTGVSAFQLNAGCSITLANTISKGGSITLDGDATALPGSTITLSSNAYTASLTVTGSLAGLSGLVSTTFNGNSGSWSQHLACTGAFPGTISLAGASPFQLDSGCSAALGANASKTGTLTVAGTLDAGDYSVSSGTFTVLNAGILKLTGAQAAFKTPVLNDGSTVVYDGAGTYSKLMAGSSYSTLLFSGTGTYSTSTPLTVSGDFTQTGGAFTPSATTTFSGSSSATVTPSSGTHFSGVLVSKTSATVSLAGDLSASDLELSGGTLDASASGCGGNSCAISLTGNWANTGGTFVPRTGTVTFAGASQAISGDNSFYNLTKAVSSAATWSFGAGSTQTVGGTWTAQGAAGNLLSLRSSSDAAQWSIDPQGTRSLSYVDIKDSNNTDASAIAVNSITSTDSGNNTNYAFAIPGSAPAAPDTLGPAAYTGGSWTSDATPTLAFTTSDPDADNVQYQVQIDDSSDFSSPAVDYTSAFAAAGASSFTVGQPAGSGAYAAGSAGQTLPDGSYYWRVRAGDTTFSTSTYAVAAAGAVAFKVDATAPATGSVALSDITESSITATLSGASDAGSGLVAAPYFWYESVSGATTGATTSAAWTLTGLAPATSYSLSVGVTDAAGNTATTSVLTVATDAHSSSPSSPSTTTPSSSSGSGGRSGSSGYVYFYPTRPAPGQSMLSSGLSNTQAATILLLLEAFGADQRTIETVASVLIGDAVSASSTPSAGSGTAAGYIRSLQVGDEGDDVRQLQAFLNAKGFIIAEQGPGSPGNETSHFGALTQAALAKYQKAFGILPATGYFGPLTRTLIEAAGQ